MQLRNIIYIDNTSISQYVLNNLHDGYVQNVCYVISCSFLKMNYLSWLAVDPDCDEFKNMSNKNL